MAKPHSVRLTLVSSSPRRRELIATLGLPFDVIPTNVSERWNCGDPALLARSNARRKVERSRCFGDRSRVLIGADTIISCSGQIMGKPIGLDAARRMLSHLSGHNHEVFTGVCLSGPSVQDADLVIMHEAHAVTGVTFNELSQSDLEQYFRSGEWKGKAGAYAIQGQGRSLIRDWQGEFDNVVGLPLGLIRDAITKQFNHCIFL